LQTRDENFVYVGCASFLQRLVSGEHRLLACSSRQPVEICAESRLRLLFNVRGKLPRTTGQRPVLPGRRRVPRWHDCPQELKYFRAELSRFTI